MTAVSMTTKKDWMTDQEVRWCPGCGDYGILQAVQFLMPDIGIAPENVVFVSGIGCSSRFPYYTPRWPSCGRWPRRRWTW